MVTMEELNNRIGTIEKAMNNMFLTTESFEDDLAFLIKCENNNDNYKNTHFFAGLTKGCIIFDDLPYVIKCGLDGRVSNYYSRSSHTESNSDIGDIEEYYDENAALDELTIYEDFKNNHLEAILAKTWQYNNKFICAEKVNKIGNDYPASNINLTKEEQEWKEHHMFVQSNYWMDKAIKLYGIEYLNNFLDYTVDNYDFIDDMHGGNYGFNEQGEPKILDFGGCSLVF